MLYYLTLLATLFMAFPAAAEHVGMKHYEAQQPTSVKNAMELLDQRTPLAEQALQKKQLEGVHEQSYTLEAAGDYLESHAKKQQQSLDAINESIQEIHALSEKGDAAGVRKALTRLKGETKTLHSLMNCQ